VQHLTVHAIDVLVLDARSRIPATGTGIVVALALLTEVLALERCGPQSHAHGVRSKPLVDPEVLHLPVALALLQTGRAPAEVLIQTLNPQVAGLAHMRVGGEDLDIVGHGCTSIWTLPR
jgi:hypothetical protein